MGSINPGTILMGSRIENSPYNFSVKVSRETQLQCCLMRTSLPATANAGGPLGLMLPATLMQVDEKTKTVCKPAGYAEALTADEAEVRDV